MHCICTLTKWVQYYRVKTGNDMTFSIFLAQRSEVKIKHRPLKNRANTNRRSPDLTIFTKHSLHEGKPPFYICTMQVIFSDQLYFFFFFFLESTQFGSHRAVLDDVRATAAKNIFRYIIVAFFAGQLRCEIIMCQCPYQMGFSTAEESGKKTQQVTA